MRRQQLPMLLSLILALLLVLGGVLRILGQPVPADDLLVTIWGLLIAIAAAYALSQSAKQTGG